MNLSIGAKCFHEETGECGTAPPLPSGSLPASLLRSPFLFLFPIEFPPTKNSLEVGGWNSLPSPLPLSICTSVSMTPRGSDGRSLGGKRNPPSQSVSPSVRLAAYRSGADDDDEGRERGREGRKEGRKCSTHERKCFEKGEAEAEGEGREEMARERPATNRSCSGQLICLNYSERSTPAHAYKNGDRVA